MARHVLIKFDESHLGRSEERFVKNVSEQLGVLLKDLTSEFAPREAANLSPKQANLTSRIGIKAAEEDRRILQQAQETSRHDARKIAKLEREVAYLRSVAHYRDKGTQTVQNDVRCPDQGPQSNSGAQKVDTTRRRVDPKEYDRIRQELAALHEEYGRVRFSRDVLERKSRNYKKALKSWQEYCKLWIDKKGPGNSERRSESEPEQRGVEGHCHIRASSAPTQLFSDGKQKLLNIYQGKPAPDQPTTTLPTSSDTHSQSSGNAPPARMQIARTDTTQDLGSIESPQLVGRSAEVGNPTQASDTDEDEREKLLTSDRNLDSRTPTVKNKELDEDSDNPVFIAVKALKRKREEDGSSISKHPKIRKEDDVPGTATKPVHIKSDPLTSSPPPKMSFQGLDGDHDSMDLDEVGSKTETPRKHQRHRLQPMRLLTTSVPPVAGPNDNEQSEEDDVSQPSILDEASCRKQGEEYGALLWRQQQARREERQDNQTNQHPAKSKDLVYEQSSRDVPIGTSEKLDSELLPAADRQVADFNQRIREAQLKRAGCTTAPKTPKLFDAGLPTVLRDMATDTRDFGLPTPFTTNRQSLRSPRQYSRDQLLQKSSITHSVLQPTDPNTHILPRTSELLTHEKRQCPPSRRDRGAAQIHTVLEDGEETHPKRKAKSGTSNADGQQVGADGFIQPSKVSLDAHYRLGTLLAEPSLGRPALPTEKLIVSKRVENRNSPRLPSDLSAARSTSPVGRSPADLPRHPHSTSKVSTSIAKSKKRNTYARKPPPPILATFDPASSDDPPPILPEDEPLRSRPVHRLQREDFKINPAANKGFSHAYCEVVRKRQERQCLPNCNRPDCCGDDIRKAIAIGGALPRQDRGLFQSSPPDGESGSKGYDYNVLKEYMGDHYSNWSRLSDEEKDAEWTRAQGWDFGRRFGKHKAPDRARTPPGFWNVDVDSTQEIRKQKEAAEKMAREEVTERWREAMRPGGRWKFADE
ncbi:MAG: hypothetical protein Q9195_003342 [Heterodermia aff. obscurata]